MRTNRPRTLIFDITFHTAAVKQLRPSKKEKDRISAISKAKASKKSEKTSIAPFTKKESAKSIATIDEDDEAACEDDRSDVVSLKGKQLSSTSLSIATDDASSTMSKLKDDDDDEDEDDVDVEKAKAKMKQRRQRSAKRLVIEPEHSMTSLKEDEDEDDSTQSDEEEEEITESVAMFKKSDIDECLSDAVHYHRKFRVELKFLSREPERKVPEVDEDSDDEVEDDDASVGALGCGALPKVCDVAVTPLVFHLFRNFVFLVSTTYSSSCVPWTFGSDC